MTQLVKKKIDVYTRKLGYNIMRIRLEKGIYLPSVSDALDISVYVLKNIENGKYPTLKIFTLDRLAKYYRVGIRNFFEGM
jgi:transcriptional regulator with XRE-family HTH domain